MKLKDKVAIVTGAGRGIGKAIAESFARQGAAVAIADIKLELAEQAARQIGSPTIAIEVDVSDAGSVEAMTEQVESRLGPLDILVNNAGVSYITSFLDCTEEIWEKTMQVNLKGAFHGSQSAIRRMLPRKRGVILNMSSQSGKTGNTHYAAYCASKFGIIGLTQSLAVEFAGDGIRVNALCPGVVFTPLWDGMIADYAKKRNMKTEEVKGYLESKVPMGRLCSPQDVANAAVFLASDEAGFITGQSINISGGIVMH
ncbi:MAG TPA: SDR family oxidoreductase [Phycisphaerae bacterium]|nr:SDR family oxidoreductase [Phycisphaerae bacterium]